jgi:cytoskeletal protein RodZ
MKFIRIFLLVLIIVGIGLLVTQGSWVPPFVNWILAQETGSQAQVTQKAIHATSTPSATSTSVVKTKPPAPTPSPQGTGTLIGSVTLSPTCPVERISPDPQCAPKPYVTTVKVLRSGSTTVLATATTQADGSFTFTLAPGSYVIQATGAAVAPTCSPITTQITKGASTTVSISCDTGIR